MSTENPYEAPASTLQAAVEVPAEVLTKIKHACMAGCISGGITLAVTIVVMLGAKLPGFDAWSLIDVVLAFALAFGIYRKSRVCAVAMLVYFVASKIFVIVETGQASGLLVSLIFIYYYWQGVSGTFAYHRIARQPPAVASEAGPQV